MSNVYSGAVIANVDISPLLSLLFYQELVITD